MIKNSLNKEELFVLRICDEEPGEIEKIKKELKGKLSEEKTKEILNQLLESKLIYRDNDNFLATTIEGTKELDKIKNKGLNP